MAYQAKKAAVLTAGEKISRRDAVALNLPQTNPAQPRIVATNRDISNEAQASLKAAGVEMMLVDEGRSVL